MQFLIFIFLLTCGNGQPQWTWRGGSNTINRQTTTTPTPYPSGRGGPVTWRFADRIYVVGGNGTVSGGAIRPLMDVWRLDLSTLTWTLVFGNDTFTTFSSTTGPNARPGARQGAAGWVDPQGNAGYLFGGLGYTGGQLAYLNDLWRFDFATNNWTFLDTGGTAIPNSPGTYPGVGVNDASTRPRSRYFANVIQSGTKVYLFGGAYAPNPSALLTWTFLNDFFVFDVTTGEWTQLGGSLTGARASGIYGPYRTAAPASSTRPYYPGGRESSIMWWSITVPTKFFMGLGLGYLQSTSTEVYLQDIWSYDTVSNLWVWEGGKIEQSSGNGRGVYTAQPMTQSFSSIIGSREDAQAFALSDGAVVFGGTGFATTSNFGWLGDTWLWDYPNDLWIWYGGTTLLNQLGTYTGVGLSGVPGCSAELSTFCSSSSCFIAMGRGYGGATGSGNGYLNSIWSLNLPNSVRSAVNFAPLPVAPLSTGAIVGIAIGAAVGNILH